VCRFVSELSYDGRLASAAGCDRQRVDTPGLSGTGLRYVPVEHQGNAQQSAEEAAAIATLVKSMLNDSSTVIDRDGNERRLTAADILVVAPYNMQVRGLRELLPADVEVGTVDKFQGREAAVVFFSMTSSSGDEVPRGLEFLFNRNRFNVAISRAKCLSVLVCSPRLLESRCHTVAQLRLVNAVCRFVATSEGR
jgi:superfamily I DNA and/or RNA helicase